MFSLSLLVAFYSIFYHFYRFGKVFVNTLSPKLANRFGKILNRSFTEDSEFCYTSLHILFSYF